MDANTTDTKQTNLYVIFAGIVVFILCVLGYFFLFAKSSVPSEFFTTYQEQDSIAKKVAAQMLFDYGSLGKAIQSQDASRAAALSKQYLVQSLKNQNAIFQIQKKTAMLKTKSGQVSDTTIREKIIKILSQLDDRNTKLANVISAQVNIFTVLSTHFGAVAVGEKGSDMPQNIDSVIQASQSEIQFITSLQTAIDVAFSEIVKLSGVDLSVSQMTDSIRMSLSATPEKDPIITDFPTATPAPTLPPTPTAVVASASATASESAH